MVPERFYVCCACEYRSPHLCAMDRHELRVSPEGDWLCRECYDGVADSAEANGVPYLSDWNGLPIPPEYAPVSDAGKK